MTSSPARDDLGVMFARPIDIAWLAAFRVLFGLTMCTSMLRFIAYGWIDSFFVRPAFHFKYWGFAWVERLPGPLMHALFWLLAGLALCMALGFCFRLAGLLFSIGFGYLQLVDVTNYLNHYYLASLLALLLSASPAARAFSLDARLGITRASSHVATGWLALFRFQVGVVYVFAGLAKAHADWLLHAQPLRIWLATRTDTPLIGALLAYDWAAPAMSWAGFLFDTGVVALLLIRRTRPYAYLAVIAFHLLTRVLFPIGMFPVIMVLGALVFFSPEWPRLGLAKLGLAVRAAAPRPVQRGALSRAALGIALAYCLVQLLVPLRFLAYGGDVRWHEQGMRFSWRVMVREKNGSVTFRVRSLQTGRIWELTPHRYLTRLQEREMASQPDLILQFAHFLRDEFARRGLGPVQVYADALVSLNGRRMARMIDASVDLAATRDGLWRATWILPAPSSSPPHLRAQSAALSLPSEHTQ